jgi:hypothetical protein
LIGIHVHLGTLGREGVTLGQGLWGGDIGQGVSGTGAFGWVFLGWGIQVGVSGRDIRSGLLGQGPWGFLLGFPSGHLVWGL